MLRRQLYLSILLFSAAAITPASLTAGDLTFGGLTADAIKIDPAATTGLRAIFVLPHTQGVTATYTPSNPGATVSWQKFSALGGGYAEPVESRDGAIRLTPGDMGYIVTEDTEMTCYWIVDYSGHPCEISGIALSSESDCSSAILEIAGTGADAIKYYTINGVPQTLSREFELTYRTLEFDEDAFSYTEITKTDILDQIGQTVITDAPLCATEFCLTGDRFLRQWNEEISVTSDTMEPIAVQASTRATQTTREVDNEQKVETNLGGSAPCEIRFESVVTDAAIYRQWEIARDSEFNIVTLQYNEPDFTYTFREQGTSYVRLVCANASGECETYSETYEVFIGESDLKCPNAFSPGGSPGVNDEWRVSYKSIISFECHIFNRWGQQLAHLTDPSQGWDGKSNGKIVPAGVYFYVISAKGADGRKYKLKGDINVVRQGRDINSSSSEQ